jgi:chromosomal replication initiation ATPase DnaA
MNSQASEQILRLTCWYFRVGRDELVSKNRQPHLVIARQVAAYLLYLHGLTEQRIGEILSYSDHSTVSYDIRQIERERVTNDNVRRTVEMIEGHLSALGPWKTRVIREPIRAEELNRNAQVILEAVCSYYGVSPSSVLEGGRKPPLIIPRMVSMYLLKEILHLSYPKIARFMRRKNHTTVMHAVETIAAREGQDKSLRTALDRIKRILGGIS